MVNHPNRNAATVETLRSHLVPVSKKIKHGEFSKVSEINGERLILEANWVSRQIFVTVVQGGYGPTQITRGFAESFNVNFLFPRHRTVNEVIGFSEGDLPKGNFNKMYQEYILDKALAAQVILESAPVDEEVRDDVKSHVRTMLDPYQGTSERQLG